MAQRGIESVSQRAEDGDLCPRRRSCKSLCADPHLTIDETNPSIRARDLRNAERTAQIARVCRHGDLHELPRQSRPRNQRGRKRQYIDARDRGFMQENLCLLDYLRQGHPLRRHNLVWQVYKQDADSA